MLHKKLDNGFQVPFIPRAARSSRRRSLVQKSIEDNHLCAFDLLATVAGKILLEGESSHLRSAEADSSYVQDAVMEEAEIGNQSVIVEHRDQGNIETASPSLTLELGIPGLDQDHNVKEVSPFDCLEKNGSCPKINLNGDPCVPSVVEDMQGSDSHCIDDPEILDGKLPELVSSDSCVKFTLSNDHYPCSSLSPCRDNNVNVVRRDDDENCSECIQPSTIKNARLPARIGDRRIRKLLASKYWRIAARARDGDLSSTEVQCLYRGRKMGYKRPRSQRVYPFKKRRFYHNRLVVNGSAACVAAQSTTFSSRESHVNLRIKSFRVPELFVEMPETATIGLLKRTVMQAVSALLGNGLHVGVLHQGKKIRNDNRTLLQSGICNENKVKSLDFTLEPKSLHVGAPVCPEENSLMLSTELPQSRCFITSGIDHKTSHLSTDLLVNNLGNFVESDHDSTPSPVDVLAEKGTVDSCAIVALPEGTPQPLAVADSYDKSKRSDMCQRRIRRPFSVSEVEALVLAVEKLGTGRWRDVKLRAFDSAKHRTYVDLKDKWKTLVHTARIAPQQRRGEPVPQELLDRVLAAHGYWTQHGQQQPMQPPSMTCLLLR